MLHVFSGLSAVRRTVARQERDLNSDDDFGDDDEGTPEEIKEFYPILEATGEWWRDSYGDAPLKALTAGVPVPHAGVTADLNEHNLRFRAPGQRKDEKDWKEFLRTPPQERQGLRPPPAYISFTEKHSVKIGVYDKAGHVSQLIPLTVSEMRPQDRREPPEAE
jgi:hypothetical protein